MLRSQIFPLKPMGEVFVLTDCNRFHGYVILKVKMAHFIILEYFGDQK